MWQPGGAGSLGENGYIYIWLSPFPVHLKLSHNIVNQLYSNIKKFKKKTNTHTHKHCLKSQAMAHNHLWDLRPASLSGTYFLFHKNSCLKGPF